MNAENRLNKQISKGRSKANLQQQCKLCLMHHLVLEGCDFLPAAEGTLRDFDWIEDKGETPWK
jgi:hypothetical protein